MNYSPYIYLKETYKNLNSLTKIKGVKAIVLEKLRNQEKCVPVN